MPTTVELMLEPTPSDRVVLVNEFRTMCLKWPAVDMMYAGGKLHTSDNGEMVPVANGDSMRLGRCTRRTWLGTLSQVPHKAEADGKQKKVPSSM